MILIFSIKKEVSGGAGGGMGEISVPVATVYEETNQLGLLKKIKKYFFFKHHWITVTFLKRADLSALLSFSTYSKLLTCSQRFYCCSADRPSRVDGFFCILLR